MFHLLGGNLSSAGSQSTKDTQRQKDAGQGAVKKKEGFPIQPDNGLGLFSKANSNTMTKGQSKRNPSD